MTAFNRTDKCDVRGIDPVVRTECVYGLRP